ncbi:MAG TPA: hypothetical protein VHP81_00950, partial [Lachnospiraceae bacterium]|nr:hypothetical protein [Lachnospiraceae bacterium]
SIGSTGIGMIIAMVLTTNRIVTANRSIALREVMTPFKEHNGIMTHIMVHGEIIVHIKNHSEIIAHFKEQHEIVVHFKGIKDKDIVNLSEVIIPTIQEVTHKGGIQTLQGTVLKVCIQTLLGITLKV